MTQPATPPEDDSVAEGKPASALGGRSALGEILDRLSYTVGLGSVMLIVVAIPALFWPNELGRYFNRYLYALMLVIAYFCVPFARRYMPRIKRGQ